LRVAVIGRGFGERVVAPAFQAVDGIEVVEVVSPRDTAGVDSLCNRSDVDLIAVHSPPFLHLEHVRRAVECGHDVLCDKPFGRNAAEAAEMRDLAKAAGVLHFLNYEYRYDDARRAVYDAVADGAVGEPEHVAFTVLMSVSRSPLRPYGWLFDAAAGGGWLRAMGAHQIDFTRWTFGEIVEAAGQLRTVVAERPDAAGTLHRCTADDGFALTLRSERGVSVVMDGSSAAPVNLPLSLVVIGPDGALEEAGNRVVLHTADGDREIFSAQPTQNPLVPAMQRYAGAIRDAIRERRVPPDVPTFDDGFACAIVMDSVASTATVEQERDRRVNDHRMHGRHT
jgi:predicted dehydrogenase